MRSFRPWTKEEDEILYQAIQTQVDEPINWLEVASHLNGRSNKDCRKRWVYSLAPSIRKGPWTEWEDTALCEGVQLYGTRWSRVSHWVGTRQPDQCARRWHEAVKPNINRGRWSLFDEHMLQNAVRAHGRRWTEIVERYFPDRTPIAARNRYDHLRRKKLREDQALSNELLQRQINCLSQSGDLQDTNGRINLAMPTDGGTLF